MACQNEDPTESIPPFAKPLAPYIKSRQEALRIRQALTLYLRSHIDFADDDSANSNCHAQSHLALCAPHDAVVDVKRIPLDLTGLRKEYLQALQANVAARKKYNCLVENVTTAKLQREGSLVPSETPSVGEEAGSGLQTYLAFLRDRRRHAKLQVFRHYLLELKARDAARSEYFELNEDCRSQQVPSPGEFDGGGSDLGGAEDGGIEGLVHKLERAVIRAKSQLDREKRLLEELKEKRSLKEQEVSPAAKVMALQRTRDELVQWVEEKLVTVSGNEDSPLQEVPPEEVEESTQLLEERKEQIRKQYAAYVEARRGLLGAISGACQPVAAAASTKPQRRITTDNGRNAADSSVPSLDSLNILSFASEILLPLSKSQKALALQKSYLSGLLAKEKYTTLRILNRLSDESHLLPEYPILARQPRFRHAVAAISSRSAADANNEQNKTDEVVALAQAWAFASEAAQENQKEIVEQKAAMGAEITKDAQQTLKEVYSILNQDLDDAVQDDQDKEDEGTDIWAYEARSTRSRGRQTRPEKRPKGPWSGLNGRVGVTGDA